MIQLPVPVKFQLTPAGLDSFLLELLMVIGIIGICITLAIPYYQMYMKRAQLSEAMQLGSAVVRTEMAEYYSIYGKLPTTTEELKRMTPFKTSGNYVEEVAVENSTVVVTMKAEEAASAGQWKLTLRPALIGQEYSFIVPICGHAPVPPHAVVFGVDKTTVPAEYLSHFCR